MSNDNLTNSIGNQQGIEFFDDGDRRPQRLAPTRSIKEAARKTPVFAEVDVLVVGGGPSGTAAALAASRVGAQVMLLERYNHLGGLSTGGLVRCNATIGTSVDKAAASEGATSLCSHGCRLIIWPSGNNCVTPGAKIPKCVRLSSAVSGPE